MPKTISIPLLAALLFGIAGAPSFAFDQPPLNLGLTDILDGALPGPGTYFTAGQAFHFNYSFGYENFKDFRGAVAGYYLKQLSDDKVEGLESQWESSAENRPEGNRTTFRMAYKF